jgi:hypothetical protein
MKTSQSVAFFRGSFSVGLAGFILLAAMTAFGQAQADPWLILASGEKGAINSHTTRKDLVRMYGAANVVDQDMDNEDGERQSGTDLFPKNPQRQIIITWKDPDNKTAPEFALILGKKSLWHGVHGITLGTSVRELERLNGRPFHFALTNDGTCEAEETISWQGGRLEKELQGNGGIILEIESSPTKGAKQTGPADFEVDSDNPVWRAQNPHISKMTWSFASNEQQ